MVTVMGWDARVNAFSTKKGLLQQVRFKDYLTRKWGEREKFGP